jgi:hypothetical protein
MIDNNKKNTEENTIVNHRQKNQLSIKNDGDNVSVSSSDDNNSFISSDDNNSFIISSDDSDSNSYDGDSDSDSDEQNNANNSIVASSNSSQDKSGEPVYPRNKVIKSLQSLVNNKSDANITDSFTDSFTLNDDNNSSNNDLANVNENAGYEDNSSQIKQNIEASIKWKSDSNSQSSGGGDNVSKNEEREIFGLDYDITNLKFKLKNATKEDDCDIKGISPNIAQDFRNRMLKPAIHISVKIDDSTQPVPAYMDGSVIIFDNQGFEVIQEFIKEKLSQQGIVDDSKVEEHIKFKYYIKFFQDKQVYLNDGLFALDTQVKVHDKDWSDLLYDILEKPRNYENTPIKNDIVAVKNSSNEESFVKYSISSITPVLDNEGKISDIKFSTRLEMNLNKEDVIKVKSLINPAEVVFQPDEFNMTYPKITYKEDGVDKEIYMKTHPQEFAKKFDELFNDKQLKVEVGKDVYKVSDGQITLNGKEVQPNKFTQAVKDVENERSQPASRINIIIEQPPKHTDESSSRLSQYAKPKNDGKDNTKKLDRQNSFTQIRL